MDKKEAAETGANGKKGPVGTTGVRKGPNVVGGIILAVVIIAGATWGTLRFIDTVTYVSTDDAAVDGTQVSVSAKILGRVAEIPVAEGDSVKAGDLLARLDDADMKAQEAQVIASLNTARKSLALAKVNLDNSESDLDRVNALYANGAATREARDHSRNAQAAANAQYELAQAQVDAASAQLGVVETQLLNTEIRSPIDGTVDHVTADVGDVVQPTQKLVTVANLADLWVTANLEETKIARVKAGAPVKITVDAWKDIPFTGTVETIRAGIVAPAFQIGEFTKTTQRVPVKIRFDPEFLSGADAPRLLPGLSVEVKVRTRP